MKISVAICTWNRAKLLDHTLAQLHNLRVPESVDWELLIVNNNCTDDTDTVIARHSDTLPLRRLFEPKPGLSNARNCAIVAARGELILWTDDDVLVDLDWMTEYVKAAQAWPEASFFGGTIEPWYAGTPPHWLTQYLDRLSGPLVIRNLGPESRRLRDSEEIYGANMAFRTEVLQSVPFNPALGRVKNALTPGEETDVMNRLKAAGHFGVWLGSARVRHYIPVERMTLAFMRRWFTDSGRVQGRMTRVEPAPMLFGVPRWMLRRYGEKALLARLLRLTPGSYRWLGPYFDACEIRGMMAAIRAGETMPLSQAPAEIPA